MFVCPPRAVKQKRLSQNEKGGQERERELAPTHIYTARTDKTYV